MAFLLFITALALSGIAAYYSVIGLIAIFSASVIPVAVMGGSLEVAKLVVASWLYRYWKNIPFLMKSYFTSALLVLMIITSMGIFGFLSKAHIEQGVTTGDFIAKIELIDEKIKIERDNIENARSVIKQLDDAVNGINANGSEREIKLRDGRTYTRSAAELALQVRRSQATDRANLTKQIEDSQNKIISLQQEAAPLRAESRKIEAEVGPIKYVAAMIYGDNPDQNMLEAAVRWLILLLICVFDPLAVLMLIAANLTMVKTGGLFGTKYEKDNKPDDPSPTPGPTKEVVKEKEINEEFPLAYTPEVTFIVKDEIKVAPEQIKEEEPKYEKDDGPLTNTQLSQVVESVVPTPPAAKKPRKQKISKKKISEPIEQVAEDKSLSNTFEPVAIKSDDTLGSLEEMIESGDVNGLEEVYKKIVKELGKKNRAKTTHWGPLKTSNDK